MNSFLNEKWTDSEYNEFIGIIESICLKTIKKYGVSVYKSAKVVSRNDDGSYNLLLPTENSEVKGRLNKSGSDLVAGDSVQILCKDGNLSNSWIAVKHG